MAALLTGYAVQKNTRNLKVPLLRMWTILAYKYRRSLNCLYIRTEKWERATQIRTIFKEIVQEIGIKMAAEFYNLTAKLLTGQAFNFSSLQGKVVLIENVASLWGTTTRDYTQMNELHDRYASMGLVVLGVPCNQFGHQVRISARFLSAFGN